MTHGISRLLSALLILVIVAIGLVQAVILPMLSAELATEYPEVAYLRWPYMVCAILALAAVQVVLGITITLLHKVTTSQIFEGSAIRLVTATIYAGAFFTTVSMLVLGHAMFFAPAGGPGVLLITMLAILGGATFTLLMLVMRSLLAQATTMTTDLAGVI